MSLDLTTYCANTVFCQNPLNSGHDVFVCQNCGADLLVNERYRLTEILNRENGDPNRVVYRGFDTQENCDVVVKMTHNPSPEARKYLEREYEFLLGGNQLFPQIEEDAYFEWSPDKNSDFFVLYGFATPFIQGVDSLDWIAEHGTISESKCIQWVLAILEYLEFMSSASFIHRDIKPENIIVTPDELIKLIDFGSVRQLDEEYMALLEGQSFDVNGNLRTATRVQTFGYTAPEQAIGKAVMQSDFYSLGYTAIYWVTGKTPAAMILDGIEDWSEAAKTSQTFNRFIQWLIAPKAANRPIDATAIRTYLDERYPIEIKTEKNKKSKKSYFLVSALAMGLLFLCGFGATEFFLSQAKKSIESSDYTRAINELEIAKLNPWSNEPRKLLGYTHLWNGNEELAQQHLENALTYEPNDPGVIYHLGILNEQRNKLAVAEDFYKQALELEPIQIESELRLARIALGRKDLGQADMYLNKVVDKVQKYPEKSQETDQYFVNFYLGWLHYEQQDFENAFSFLLNAYHSPVSLSPAMSVTLGDVACLLADTQIKLNKPVEFVQWQECFTISSSTEIGQKLSLPRLETFINNSIE